MNDNTERFLQFFESLDEMKSEDFEAMVDEQIGDDLLDLMSQHIEDFYGIDDDEELASLCQIMITGFLAGRLSRN